MALSINSEIRWAAQPGRTEDELREAGTYLAGLMYGSQRQRLGPGTKDDFLLENDPTFWRGYIDGRSRLLSVTSMHDVRESETPYFDLSDEQYVLEAFLDWLGGAAFHGFEPHGKYQLSDLEAAIERERTKSDVRAHRKNDNRGPRIIFRGHDAAAVVFLVYGGNYNVVMPEQEQIVREILGWREQVIIDARVKAAADARKQAEKAIQREDARREEADRKQREADAEAEQVKPKPAAVEPAAVDTAVQEAAIAAQDWGIPVRSPTEKREQIRERLKRFRAKKKEQINATDDGSQSNA